jgi:ketosteroid isomerase-like protein
MKVDEFLAEVLPRLTAADTALHNGDAEPRKALWSRTEPVTLFGAAGSDTGPSAIWATFDWLGTRFSGCRSFDYEVVAAGVSGDLRYIVGIEHTTASIGGAPPAPYSLRVTTVLRREAGGWKVVHRHADHAADSAADQDALSSLQDQRTT